MVSKFCFERLNHIDDEDIENARQEVNTFSTNGKKFVSF